MPHRDVVNWVAGAAVVLATVLLVLLRPPRRSMTTGLRGARVLFVVFGMVLGAIIVATLICAGK